MTRLIGAWTDLRGVERDILIALAAHDGDAPTNTKLAMRAGSRPTPTVTKARQALEAKGLVEAARATGDDRELTVSLTAEGDALVTQHCERLDDV